MSNRSYSELILLPTFEERLEYLKIPHPVGEELFGYNRWLNQEFYGSKEWRLAKNDVVIRDDGCDLGIPGFKIAGMIIVHHIRPVTLDDLVKKKDWLLDPEYLISVSDATHRAITYGSLPPEYVYKERQPNDTIFWERMST